MADGEPIPKDPYGDTSQDSNEALELGFAAGETPSQAALPNSTSSSNTSLHHADDGDEVPHPRHIHEHNSIAEPLEKGMEWDFQGRLSAEMVTTILDDTGNDNRTLKECAMVCREWRRYLLPRLFRFQVFAVGCISPQLIKPYTLENADKFFSENRHLCPLVKSLTLVSRRDDLRPFISLVAGQEPEVTSSFVNLINLFHGLRHLTLQGVAMESSLPHFIAMGSGTTSYPTRRELQTLNMDCVTASKGTSDVLFHMLFPKSLEVRDSQIDSIAFCPKQTKTPIHTFNYQGLLVDFPFPFDRELSHFDIRVLNCEFTGARRGSEKEDEFGRALRSFGGFFSTYGMFLTRLRINASCLDMGLFGKFPLVTA